MVALWDRVASWIGGLFPRVTKYRFGPGVIAGMRELALQTHPKEVIALLQGTRELDVLVVDSIVYQPFQNTRTSATIMQDSALTGIVGSFHSHPGAQARPSAQDLRHFARAGGIHGIIAEPYNEVHMFDSRGRLLEIHAIPGMRARNRKSDSRILNR